MIDAIKNYSSNHGGRKQLTTTPITFKRSFEDGVDYYYVSEIPKTQKQSELGSFLFVSGCAGAISMITDTLLNAGELMKSNFKAVKSIAKNAGIWALIGGACFGFFKAIEHVATNNNDY